MKQKPNQSPKMSCLKYGELTWRLCLVVNGDVHEGGPTSNRTSGTITATLAKAAIPRPFLAGAAAAFPCRVHSQKALGSFEEPVMMVENRFAS